MAEYLNTGSMLPVGAVLKNSYRIERYLSSGGFGNTYVATIIEFDEIVVIKEFFISGVTERDHNSSTVSVSNSTNQLFFEGQLKKFKKEARRLRKLKHDNIVSVHDLFEENGTAYYVMDYIDGESLSERIKRTGLPIGENDAINLFVQVLNALETVHEMGIWHLDLKPGNIMVDRNGHVKLIDFGASKQQSALDGGITTSSAVAYTNGYAPREQMEQNIDKFGPWTDIYALGATLYNLLTTFGPPLPTDLDDDETPDKSRALPMPYVSEKVKRLILWMMQTNRKKRPQSIAQVRQFLFGVDDSKTVASPIRNGKSSSNNQNNVSNENPAAVVIKELKDDGQQSGKSNNVTGGSGDKKDNKYYKVIIFAGLLGIFSILAIFKLLYSDELQSDIVTDDMAAEVAVAIDDTLAAATDSILFEAAEIDTSDSYNKANTTMSSNKSTSASIPQNNKVNAKPIVEEKVVKKDVKQPITKPRDQQITNQKKIQNGSGAIERTINKDNKQFNNSKIKIEGNAGNGPNPNGPKKAGKAPGAQSNSDKVGDNAGKTPSGPGSEPHFRQRESHGER